LQPLPLLHEATLEYLRHTKNLLAFSGGGDSTALFFLLFENKIPFDIVHVNYQTRAQSNEEEAYARTLATTHTKELFTFIIKIEDVILVQIRLKSFFTDMQQWSNDGIVFSLFYLLHA
jgi:tRNA(Ile)-lysidine synthase